jgi:hypothetical protein
VHFDEHLYDVSAREDCSDNFAAIDHQRDGPSAEGGSTEEPPTEKRGFGV